MCVHVPVTLTGQNYSQTSLVYGHLGDKDRLENSVFNSRRRKKLARFSSLPLNLIEGMVTRLLHINNI